MRNVRAIADLGASDLQQSLHTMADLLSQCLRRRRGGQAPSELAAFLPWSMEAARRAELYRALALAPVHQPPVGINSS